MPRYEDRPFGRELLSNRTCLFRIAGVIANFKLERLAKNAAGLVDIGNGGFRARLELSAEGGVFAGRRSSDSDGHFGLCGSWDGKPEGCAESAEASQDETHLSFPF